MHRIVLTALAVTLAIACTAQAAGSPDGGLSISPAFVEHQAASGQIGAVRVTNSSQKTIAVTLRARPWLQSRDGAVNPDAKRSLTQVRLAATTFKLAPDQTRSVPLRLVKVPGAGSLYGVIEVIGTVQGIRPKNGIVTRYRLLGGLRLDPATARQQLRVQVGQARVASGRAVVAVRNAGNTVRPVTGSVRVTGPTGTLRSTISSRRIVPGAIVDVPLNGRRLQPGAYRATVTLQQGGRRVAKVTRSFRVS